MELKFPGMGSVMCVEIGYANITIEDNLWYFAYLDIQFDLSKGKVPIKLSLITMPNPPMEVPEQERVLCYGNITSLVGMMTFMPDALKKPAMVPIPGRLLNLIKNHKGDMEKASCQYLKEQEMLTNETDKTVH